MEDVRQAFGCGPDAQRHLEVAGQFADAGFDHLALINAGPDMDAFFEHAETSLIPALRDSRG